MSPLQSSTLNALWASQTAASLNQLYSSLCGGYCKGLFKVLAKILENIPI